MTQPRAPGTDRHILGTHASQTSAPNRASVSAEGGGIGSPALMGGGTGFSREHFYRRTVGLEEAAS
jgi:hypothetical protein